MRTMSLYLLATLVMSTGALGQGPPVAARSTEREPGDSASIAERRAQRARSGAGLRLGSWRVSGLAERSGASYSVSPSFDAYWQRGLDRHLVMETGFGLWRREETATSTSGSETVGAYIVPLLTSVKLYPFTGPEHSTEPFLAVGAGFTLGVDDRQTVSGGLLGGSGGGGTTMIAGVGLRAAAGVEYRFSRAFGLQAAASFQYVRFFEQLAGERTFKGAQLAGGFTYRFQY
ncbi:MAG TPA: hypothetical protein VNL98_06310 [Gemmatimonadales bacterium]|nr:hypothetical protein [Gemmatimonadales bacterium]